VSEVKRLIRSQSFNNGVRGSIAARSDRQLIGMLFHAVVDEYVRRVLARIFNKEAQNDSALTMSAGGPVKGEDFSIISVVTKDAQPELMWSIDSYNLVKFDGMFYGVPHGTAVDWDSGMAASIPAMLVGESLEDVVSMIERGKKTKEGGTASGSVGRPLAIFTKVPVLLGTMHDEGYNVISYEGWIYGMPHALGPIDLTEVDVMEMPGVIRDVSRDAVESEIIARSSKTFTSCSRAEV
jgi:hypothetical protein